MASPGLEPISNDRTAIAPEPYAHAPYQWSGYNNAPELDRSENAPQVAAGPRDMRRTFKTMYADRFVLSRQAVLGRDGLEPVFSPKDYHGKEVIPSAPPNRPRRHTLFWRSKTCVLVLLGLLVLVAVLAVGLSVGLTKRLDSSDNSSENTPSSASDNGSNSASRTTHVPSSTSITTPTGTPAALQHGILDDSSFAAMAMTNNDRYIFFQDQNGTVRQAIYAQSSSAWVTNIDLVVATNARNHTPMATALISDTINGDTILLFYIATNNTIALASSSAGSASELSFAFVGGIPSPEASSNTRSLSIAPISGSTPLEFLLFYNASAGGLTALHGVAEFLNQAKSQPIAPVQATHTATSAGAAQSIGTARPKPPTPLSSEYIIKWQNLTNFTTSGFSEPFTSAPTTLGVNSTAFVAWYNPSGVDGGNVMLTQYSSAGFEPLTPEPFLGPDSARSTPANTSVVTTSDFLMVSLYSDAAGSGSGPYGLWVNGSTLSIFPVSSGNGPTAEKNIGSPFPFKRLASITAVNSTNFYLYHQINETTFAEDFWETDVGEWTASVNVSIKTQ